MLISVIVGEIWSLMASLLTLPEPCYWHRSPLHGVANVLSLIKFSQEQHSSWVLESTYGILHACVHEL